jgi:outer membrane protease
MNKERKIYLSHIENKQYVEVFINIGLYCIINKVKIMVDGLFVELFNAIK